MPGFDFTLAGRYRLVAPLGEGGMASVYRARDLRLNREVAIKVLRDELTGDPDYLSRFEREAQMVASLSHPAIVPVYDVGEENGTRYIVMEYVRGRTLRDAIEAEGSLGVERALDVMRAVLEALSYAHGRGLVHRDVKPHNILLADGRAKLADFGIAHLTDSSVTRTAAILGSAHYLSPEQSRGEEATPRSDLYACGIVLFEMLAGHPPFDGPNALSIAHQHLNAAAPSLAERVSGLDPGIEQAVRTALAKDPEDRFPDAATFLDALTGKQQELASTSIQPLLSPPAAEHLELEEAPLPRISVRRSARKSYLLALVLAALVAAAAYAANLRLWGHALPDYPSAPYAALPAALAAAVVISWLNTRACRYTLDGNAAVAQWGLLGHHRLGLPLHQIGSVQLKQSPVDRLLGVGVIELRGRDRHGTERSLLMEDVPRPRQTYDELLQLVADSVRSRLQS